MAGKANVLVVGGAGYIGSHAVKQLAHAGYDTVALDNLVQGHREAVRSGAFEQGDMGDLAFVRDVFARHRVDAVMHFGAFAFVGESVTDPAKYYANNVAATITLLQAMRDASCRKIIFSSTCATYGEPERTPIPEDHPQRPINPYGRSKWMVEQILGDYGRAYALQSIIFRYFNAAGADPDGDIGEWHEPETHLIPLIFEAIRAGKPINIFGDDYPTPDGTCVRDYIHVVDLARAHVLGLEHLLAGGASGIYNLGNGSGYSVKQVIETVERVTGKKVPITVGPRRAGDPAVLVGTSHRAVADLGWRPAFSQLEQIVETAWRWHQRSAH
jgi:UDP-glucose 4-epimerase